MRRTEFKDSSNRFKSVVLLLLLLDICELTPLEREYVELDEETEDDKELVRDGEFNDDGIDDLVRLDDRNEDIDLYDDGYTNFENELEFNP